MKLEGCSFAASLLPIPHPPSSPSSISSVNTPYQHDTKKINPLSFDSVHSQGENTGTYDWPKNQRRHFISLMLTCAFLSICISRKYRKYTDNAASSTPSPYLVSLPLSALGVNWPCDNWNNQQHYPENTTHITRFFQHN